jgi:glycosyltransferase involved in cell wall biosynthesis
MRIFENSKIRIHSSFLQNIPFIEKYSKVLAITRLFYIAFESFDFDNFDIVFSSSTRYAHSIITKPGVKHVAYINSPPKMFWEVGKYYFGRKILFILMKFFLPKLRQYDFYTRYRADLYISNSKNISNKLQTIYTIYSEHIYPFVEVKLPNPDKNYVAVRSFSKIDLDKLTSEKFFLVISRLTKWKKIDYVIEAFSKINCNLYIIGDGDMKSYYQNRFSKNIKILGFLTNQEKYNLLRSCEAVIIPQDEDFGLVIVESLIFGKPLLYYDHGGAREILNESLGTAFESQSAYSLIEAIERNKKKTYNYRDLQKASNSFSKERFFSRLNNYFDII